MDQLPLVNFENSRVRVFVCQNTLVLPLIVKSWSLVGEGLIMAKGGVFEIVDQFLLEQLLLCLNECF